MIATLLIALFAAAAIGSGVVLADSAVRGRNAFRRLHGELARIGASGRVSIRFDDPRAALPALRRRAVNGDRAARPPVRSPARSLPAAA